MNKSTDIISIGEAMVELTCEGDLRSAGGFNRNFGGDTLNTAVAARRLGSQVTYVTRFSADPFGQALQELLSREGIGVSHPRPTSRGGTGVYFVAVGEDANREFFYYRKDSAASLLVPEDITPMLIESAKVVYSSGVSLAISDSSRKAVLKAFRLAREAGVMTAFDPNYREPLWQSVEKAVDALSEITPLVDVMLPSFPEDTGAIVGFNRPDLIIDYFLFKGVKVVAVKAGADGCYIGYKKEVEHIPAMAVRPVDTTGAGDAFNGGFLHGLVTGESLLDCAKIGITAAGLKVLNRGSATAMPSKDMVYSRLH